jgi:drug/metabolite transporter (DMT)-like permease
MVIFLVPLGILEWIVLPRADAVDWMGKKPDLPFPIFVHVLFAGFAWGGNVVLWVVALQYTSTVHASLITSTQPMILSIYYQCIGQPVSGLEWLGIFVCSLGIGIASMTKMVSSQGSESAASYQAELWGDILCLLSAFFEVFILINRQKVKPYCPLLQYTAFTTIVVVFVSTSAAVILEDCSILGLGDHSVFGWASRTWAHLMLPFGFFIGVICIAGFNYAVSAP